MELFSQSLLSFYLKALLIFAATWFGMKILRHLRIEKTIQALEQLPDDRKERIVRLYYRVISSERMFLWILPLNFLLFLVAYVLLPEADIRQFLLLAGVLLVVGYIRFVEDSFYKKRILRAIDKPVERENP